MWQNIPYTKLDNFCLSLNNKSRTFEILFKIERLKSGRSWYLFELLHKRLIVDG